MSRRAIIVVIAIFLVLNLKSAEQPYHSKKTQHPDKQLTEEILTNKEFETVMSKGRELLNAGFNAGSSYGQVWIRDLNTFINYSLQVRPKNEVRDALLKFFYFQGFDGDIVDGYERIAPDAKIDYYGRFTRYDMPGYAFHKNTVEADQESSLIQAIYKYVKATGDTSFLHKVVHGKSVLRRMKLALGYMMNFRYNRKYGMIWVLPRLIGETCSLMIRGESSWTRILILRAASIQMLCSSSPSRIL